jgi:hypothetical protein
MAEGHMPFDTIFLHLTQTGIIHKGTLRGFNSSVVTVISHGRTTQYHNLNERRPVQKTNNAADSNFNQPPTPHLAPSQQNAWRASFETGRHADVHPNEAVQ